MNHLFIKTTILASAILGFSSLVGRAQTNWILTGNSATSPGTNFLGTTDSKDLVIKTNNKEAARMDKNQNVGIGTSKPAATLDIKSKNSAALLIEPFGTAAGNTGEFRMMELAGNGTQYVGFKAPDNINNNVIWTLPKADGSNGQILTTDGAGNLSWGKSNGANTSLSNLVAPTAINNDLLPNANNSVSLGSSSFSWNNINLANLKFSDGTVQSVASRWLNNGFLVYYTGGNVGIGNSSPSIGGLIVDTRVGNTNAIFGSNTAGVSLVSNSPAIGLNAFYNQGWFNLVDGFAGNVLLNEGTGDIEFANTPTAGTAGNPAAITNRMVFTQNSFVGINTVVPSAQLEIGDPVDNTGLKATEVGDVVAIDLEKTNTSSGTATLTSFTAGDGDAVDAFADNGSGVFAFSTTNFAGFFDGNVFSTGTFQSSDEKLKQNIRDFSDAMSIIKQLHPKQYQFKREGIYAYMNLPTGDHYGLIAQDVEKVLPNLVKDTKLDTRKVRGIHTEQPSPEDVVDFKALNYTELIPVMIKAIQEQQQAASSLQQRVNDLKKNSSQPSPVVK